MLADAPAIQRRLQANMAQIAREALRRHLGEVVASKLFAPQRVDYARRSQGYD